MYKGCRIKGYFIAGAVIFRLFIPFFDEFEKVGREA